MAAPQKRRHILQYTKAELRDLGWNGATYFSHSQGGRSTPYIANFDSDSDCEYDDLRDVPEHLLPSTWQGDGNPDACTDPVGFCSSLKEKGNAAFKKRKLREALKHYDAALEYSASFGPWHNETKSVLHSNKAECLLRMRDWDGAAASANAAISHQPGLKKALWRRAKAYRMLGKLKNTSEDLATITDHRPQTARADSPPCLGEVAYDLRLTVTALWSVEVRDRLLSAPPSALLPQEELCVRAFAHTFRHLHWMELLKLRRVCRHWRFALRTLLSQLFSDQRYITDHAQAEGSSEPTAPAPAATIAPAPAAAQPQPEVQPLQPEAEPVQPWVGARVVLYGLTGRPELNGREGVIDRRQTQRSASSRAAAAAAAAAGGAVERWAVQLRTADGLRDGKTIALKPTNLRVTAPEPPLATRQGQCLELSPAPRSAARDAIPVRVAPDPLPALDGSGMPAEAREMAILRERRGWQQVRGLKAYSKAGSYPDLYCYFDAADTSSPLNNFAMAAFIAYPDQGIVPATGIRGDVVIVRVEPPRSVHMSSFSNAQAQEMLDPFNPVIRVEEMRDTLLFYLSHEAPAVARRRDMQRTMQSMPPEVAAAFAGQPQCVNAADLGIPGL